MDPFTATLLGGTVLGGLFSSFQSGKAEKAAYQAKAQQARIDAENAKIAGVEQGEMIQRQLRSTMANINVATAAGGLADSPTSAAIYARAQADSDRTEGIERYNALSKQSAYATQAQGYAASARNAIPMAVIGGLTTASGQLYRAFPTGG